MHASIRSPSYDLSFLVTVVNFHYLVCCLFYYCLPLPYVLPCHVVLCVRFMIYTLIRSTKIFYHYKYYIKFCMMPLKLLDLQVSRLLSFSLPPLVNVHRNTMLAEQTTYDLKM